jgi:aspartate/methionine/tyrosine aminotransferase
VTGAERTQLVELCATAGKALIVDEVFAAFPLDEAEPEPWGGEDRCVTIALGGLSKLVAAPSLKLAWLRLSGPRSLTAPVAAALDQVADMFLPVSAPVAAALPQILDLAPAVAGRINARLATNLATAREVLDAPFRVRRCGGGWTAVVDAPRLVPDDGLALALMTHAHLAVHPGWFYDLPDEASLALSLLPEPAVFRDHCTRLRRALQELAEADATGTSHLSPSV